MNKFIKFIHYLGLILFLGSIFTYALISSLTKNASLENVVFAREIINSGTNYITIPGLVLLLITGIMLRIRKFNATTPRWLTMKYIFVSIMVLNTIIFIVPAEISALDFARQSLLTGNLLPEYDTAYMKESFAGGLNVILAFLAVAAAIRRCEKKKILPAIGLNENNLK